MNGNSSTAGKPIRCKAAICRKAGDRLVIEEVIVAPPSRHELRIKIICTALCQSDVIFSKLVDPPAIYPRILGHEAIGVVESVGEDVTGVKPGDTVIPTFMSDCGDCADCHSEKSNLCSTLPPREDKTRFTDLNGNPLYHLFYISSFSEYTVVDSVGAAWRTAEVEPGTTVAVFGLGTIGLAAAEGARLCGAKRIIGVDVNPDKFEMGKKFGLTDFVNPKTCGDKSVSEVILEMTNGGADYCFECVGMASLVEEAFACCRHGWGKTVVLGVDKPGTPLKFSSTDVLRGHKILTGALYGGLKAKRDVPILCKRYLDKELQLDEFVTHSVKFEEINKAFDLLEEGKSLRCVIWMDK
ncbi:unnamed protein product [Linum tenue]|uniref:Alcohol dehydrogenase-like 7 n=1 Tax=Linum tenue TaxID=586396 RepID=A0AAV0LL81_9ROSI|nr:unnamed protein product [Linum tenue]